MYQTEDGQTRLEVQVDNETSSVWLSQYQMGELFQRNKSTISKHIKNIFDENELSRDLVVANFSTTAVDGKGYLVEYYNLDVIISVGYRVKSHRGTQFRVWATERLREYIIKGFALDDKRLKSAKNINYFDELLDRIRDIRSSEAVFYQKVKQIYATSIDYDPRTKMTVDFFKIVQNKLLWAIGGKTTAEIVSNRANAKQKNMGLLTWSNGPKGKIRKSDITVSKNYLNEDELKDLNLLVEQFLAFGEAQARQQKPMYMKDWINRLNAILTLNEREILTHAGQVSAEYAKEFAGKEFDKFKEQERQIKTKEGLNLLEQDLKNISGKGK